MAPKRMCHERSRRSRQRATRSRFAARSMSRTIARGTRCRQVLRCSMRRSSVRGRRWTAFAIGSRTSCTFTSSTIRISKNSCSRSHQLCSLPTPITARVSAEPRRIGFLSFSRARDDSARPALLSTTRVDAVASVLPRSSATTRGSGIAAVFSNDMPPSSRTLNTCAGNTCVMARREDASSTVPLPRLTRRKHRRTILSSRPLIASVSRISCSPAAWTR